MPVPAAQGSCNFLQPGFLIPGVGNPPVECSFALLGGPRAIGQAPRPFFRPRAVRCLGWSTASSEAPSPDSESWGAPRPFAKPKSPSCRRFRTWRYQSVLCGSCSLVSGPVYLLARRTLEVACRCPGYSSHSCRASFGSAAMELSVRLFGLFKAAFSRSGSRKRQGDVLAPAGTCKFRDRPPAWMLQEPREHIMDYADSSEIRRRIDEQCSRYRTTGKFAPAKDIECP